MSRQTIQITAATHERLKKIADKRAGKIAKMADAAINEYLDRIEGSPDDQAAVLRQMCRGLI